jgi:hypothetical protein
MLVLEEEEEADATPQRAVQEVQAVDVTTTAHLQQVLLPVLLAVVLARQVRTTFILSRSLHWSHRPSASAQVVAVVVATSAQV